MKRMLSLLAAVVMLFALIPVISFAAEVRTVYLDPVKGADTNDGLSETTPVQTVSAAYSALSGAEEGVVVFLDTLELTKSTSFPTHTIPVTITSKTGAEGIRSATNVYFKGPTTLKNMTVCCYSENSWTLLAGSGNKFTVGEGVNSLAEKDYYFCIIGGVNSGSCASVDLTVKSGHWRNIYIASHGAATVNGDCKADISGVIVDAGVSIGYKAKVTGDTTITITDSVVANVYACATQSSGKVDGNITITLGDGAEIENYVTEKSSMSVVEGTSTLIVQDGSHVTTIQKADEKEGSGQTKVILQGGKVDTCKNAADLVEIDVPQDKVLHVGSHVKADTVKCAGTVLLSGNATLEAAAVTGTVNCNVEGVVQPGHLYVDAPQNADVVFDPQTGIIENNGQWTLNGAEVDDTFQGLVLLAAPDVTVKLYTGFADGTLLEPVKTVTGQTNAYYYEIGTGNYRYVASGTGYYKVQQNIYMSAAEAATKTVMDATPPKRSGDGWEQTSAVCLYPEEVYQGIRNDDPTQWPEYADIFTTPYYTEERTAFQMTTQDQMEAFIDKLDDPGDNLYTFSAGRSSGYDYDIPVVVVTKTDLTGVETLEQAAGLVGQTKPTIFYRAHMHGSEPASGEAALAILQRLDGDLGEKVLDKIDIVIMPRNNPDGASTYTRDLTSDVDPNGDLLRVVFSETEAYLRVYDLFQPELLLDGHEYTTSNTATNVANSDALIGLGFAKENSQTFVDAYKPMIEQVRGNLIQNGLYYRYYETVVNHNGAQTSRSHSSLQGTMFVLIESQGIRSGTYGYNRRMMAQVTSMQTMIEYVAENAATIQSAVDAERQRIITMGSTYEESDQVYLELDKVSDSEWTHTATRFTPDGNVTEETITPKIWDKVLRSRVAPTAYVIPAGKSYTEDVLALMDKHNIEYTFIPAGSQVLLQQYSGTVTEENGITDVALSEETTVTFGSGAYVFCKNQVKGILLSMLMEPDVAKLTATKSGIALRGLVPQTNGKFPIYRYIHDLNTEGFIDYTLTAVQAQNITVYLDGANGLDTNDGLTEATAVKTIAQAYAIMDAAMEVASAGSQANLKIIGMYDLGTDAVDLPAVGFHVTISGKTAADGFRYTGGSTQGTRQIDIHGDTTFQNMTLHCQSTGNYNHINCNGHKVVFGEGLNCTIESSNRYFILSGGSYSADCTSTDMTVRSGKWRTIYVGGYTGDVSGLAKADISGCWVYQSIAATRQGTTGSVELKVENTAVDTADNNSAIYAGAAAKDNVLGDVTITLGENVSTRAVYASSRDKGDILGTVTVVAAGADLTKAPVYAKYSGTAGTTAAAVLKLGADVTQNVTLDPYLPVDLNGHNITGNLTVDGTLVVKDSKTDDYTVADGVYGKITGTVTGAVAAAEGYVAVENQSFHKLTMGISSVALRPSVAGIYYGSLWQCDEVLAAQITSYGVALSAENMPDAGFATDDDTLYTQMTGGDFQSGNKSTSVLVENIFKADADNDARGKTPVYALSYVTLSDGRTLVSDGVSYSLYRVIQLVDAYAYEENSVALDDFYNTWKASMETWELTNIGK